jgi:broad specificity phosphatase PhoE
LKDEPGHNLFMKTATKCLVILLALGLAGCEQRRTGATTVLIVRHAEKASDAADSPLTEAGSQRAQALVRAVEGAGVNAIYISQFKRNRDTAQPLSARAGIAVTEYPVNLETPGDYGKTLAKDILDKHAGQTVVVVGHGNTIAATVEALIGRPAQIENVEYHDLFIVNIPPSGSAKLIKAQYGLRAGG